MESVLAKLERLNAMNDNFHKQLENCYNSAKQMAENLSFDNNMTKSINDHYYFECGFVAGINYALKNKKDYPIIQIEEID